MTTITASVGRGGLNRRSDVIAVQTLINKNLQRLPSLAPLVVDGVAGAMTMNAIEVFQRVVLKMSPSDGRVDPGGRTLRALDGDMASTVTESGLVRDAPWIAVARREVGIKVKESPGLGSNNPRILEYISTFSYLKDIWRKDHAARLGDVDETPWCACFVNWCLIRAGKKSGPSARAMDWLKYGTRLDALRPGAIAVVYHTPGTSTAGTTSSGYHVAFCTGGDGVRSITLLGGNQGNRVSERAYHGYWTVKGYRWPD
jgi:uncharacterized protein (TIGR02594 family)